MKRQLLAEQWDSFARACLPPRCSATQRREMRRAFYAGAQGILVKILISLSSEAGATAEDLAVMEDLERELNDFAKAVSQGRA